MISNPDNIQTRSLQTEDYLPSTNHSIPDQAPMRILIAGTTYYPSLNGGSVFTTHLAEGLARHGHEVLMTFPSIEGHPYRRFHNGVRLEAIRAISLQFIHPESCFPPFPSRVVSDLFDSFRPDIVHVQDHYPLCRAVVLESRKRGIRVVGTNHFMPENLTPYVPGASFLMSLYKPIMWKWMMEVYRRLDVVTTQSRIAAQIVRSQGLQVPVFPVSCGIDVKRFSPQLDLNRAAYRARFGLSPDRIIFLFVGRVDREKRLDVLLYALHRLGRDDIQLAIAGQGAAVKELQALARSLQLGERVHFTGYIANEDLPGLLNSSDIFTMPSEAELLSIASLEAMACGKPMLLANAVALPELVTPGVNGYLFKLGDAEDAARYMSLLADQRNLWEVMGRASLAKAQEHSIENTLQRYEWLYQKVLAGDISVNLQPESFRNATPAISEDR